MSGDSSITWFADEATPLPVSAAQDPFRGQRVVEYVLGRNYVPLRKEASRALVRLFNTDPKNWNSFMFAFDLEKKKATIDYADILREPGAFDRVLASVGLREADKTGPIPVQYEIKQSKSSGNLTLYIFVYEITDFDRDFGAMPSEVAELTLDRTRPEVRLPTNPATNVGPVLARLAKQISTS